MDIKDFASLVRGRENEFRELVSRRLPVIAGRLAVDHFREGFRQGGFIDTGLDRWEPAKRLSSAGDGAASNYGTLLSGHNRLFSSIRSMPRAGMAVVRTDCPYARIHNEGGARVSTVTPKMRRYAWYRYYREAGIRKGSSAGKRGGRTAAPSENPRAMFWKRMALTRKAKLTARIPKRQFIGPSRVLSDNISARIEEEIRKILNL